MNEITDKHLLAIMAAIIDGADEIAVNVNDGADGMTAAASVSRAKQLLLEVEKEVDTAGWLITAAPSEEPNDDLRQDKV